jgi:uncharacterized membrane protein
MITSLTKNYIFWFFLDIIATCLNSYFTYFRYIICFERWTKLNQFVISFSESDLFFIFLCSFTQLLVLGRAKSVLYVSKKKTKRNLEPPFGFNFLEACL